jgi:2-C-methyl-D-erythritol 4-phosphate cytidylyltransferase/2-C-methyl-D-erythritol 2,4-cyclodiphosphate synthase
VKTCGIVVAGGMGSRLALGTNKALLPLCGEAVFLHALRRLRPFCEFIILVTREEEREHFRAALETSGVAADAFAPAGAQRRHSVENALALVPEDMEIVLVHDAARPFPPGALIREVVDVAKSKGAAVPAVRVADTLRRETDGMSEAVSRDNLYRVQTPQGFRRDVLAKAYADAPDALTDDAGLVEKSGHPITLTRGDAMNFKITDRGDWELAQAVAGSDIRVGTGYDAHRLVPGRALVLCGVDIPFELGLLGHSDADVALHALMDALLGAAALGDIGAHFPDSDGAYRDISSLTLLEKTRDVLQENGFAPLQADITVIAQRPKLAPWREQMRENAARALRLPVAQISVKATTTEGMGFEGEGIGISAQAVATIARVPR